MHHLRGMAFKPRSRISGSAKVYPCVCHTLPDTIARYQEHHDRFGYGEVDEQELPEDEVTPDLGNDGNLDEIDEPEVCRQGAANRVYRRSSSVAGYTPPDPTGSRGHPPVTGHALLDRQGCLRLRSSLAEAAVSALR